MSKQPCDSQHSNGKLPHSETSENTRRLSSLVFEERRKLDTVPELESMMRKSISQQMGDKWSGAPSWSRGLVIVILALAGSSAAIIQIIEALK